MVNQDGNLAQIFNESDGGGVIFEDKGRKLKTFVGVNDGKDPSTGIHAQIYSKNITTNEGARLNINPSGMYYGVGSSTPIDAAHELATKGDIPSIDGLVTEQQLTDAVSDKATIDQVAAVDQKVDAIDLTPYAEKTEVSALEDKIWNKSGDYFQTKYTKDGKTAMLWNESDGGGAIFETSELKSFVGVNDGGDASTGVHVQIYSKNKSDNVGSRLNVNPSGIFYGVGSSAQIDADHELAVKGDIPSVEGLITEQQLADAIEPKANSADVYSKTEADAKFITEHQDLSEYAKSSDVASADTSVLQNILGRIWTKQTPNPSDGYFYTKLNTAKGYSLLFNESDGGGSQFRDDKTISYVGVNDGGENTSTGIFAQIYSKNISTNEGARLNINPSGIFYGVGASSQIDADHELAVMGDINEAVSKKANADEVVSKTEYAALLAKTEYLEQLIREYLPGAADEIIADGEISELSPEKKSVNILTPMKSIVVPETTGTTTYTIQAPLLDNSTVELTSNKSVTIYNTSDDAVSTAITGPVTESTTNPSVTLSGEFNTLTLENVSVSSPFSSTGKSPATVKDVIITENNTKPVSITADFQDGATITNNSACNVSISNRNAVESSMTIVAPNSTVTLNSGQFNTVESTVGDNTLIVKNSVHINKLIVTKGNVVVDTYSVEECIDEVVNETEYTVTPVIVEVSTKSEWSKISSKSALFVVQNDIMDANIAATGIFGGIKAKINLNGHTVKCIAAADNSYNLMARGNNLYIFENGTLECENGYGLWTYGETVMELHNVHVKVGGAHALYIEKSGGQFITSGNCRFEVTGDDKTFVVNYFDKAWNEGWRGFHFGEGTEFVDFNPAASMSEPGGPVNLLDAGYHTESHQEGEHTIWTVVKDA